MKILQKSLKYCTISVGKGSDSMDKKTSEKMTSNPTCEVGYLFNYTIKLQEKITQRNWN